MENHIVVEIINELESDFCQLNGKDKINEWKNFLNQWYYKGLNRYQYELKLYIIKNLNTKINEKLETMSLSDGEKIVIFNRFNNTIYKNGLFNGQCNLLLDVNVCYEIVDDSVNKKDFLALGYILSNAKNAVEIYKVLESDWRYQIITIRDFSTIINQAKNTKNRKMFDLLFDELCMKDAHFGYSFIAFLQNNIEQLSSTNALGIIKNIYIGGDDIRYIDKHLKKSLIILNLIKNNKLNVDPEISQQVILILRQISKGDNTAINTVVKKFSKREKEKIKFYTEK